MNKFKVIREERHSQIIEADNYGEASDKANELASDVTTYECCISQEIREIE